MLEWVADIVKQAIGMAAGILLAGAPLLLPCVRDFVMKKIQLSFDKVLEDKKSINERKNYVSKVKFDKEFELYQNISHKQIDVIYDCGTAVVIARGGYKESVKRDEFLKEFLSHLEKADIHLKCYAPFISLEVFECYREIDRIAREIARILSALNFSLSMEETKSMCVTEFKIGDEQYTDVSAKQKIEELQKQITLLLEKTHQIIRTHLASLEKI